MSRLVILFRKRWVQIIAALCLLQALGFFLGVDDIQRLRGKLHPRHSSTVGLVIFDGGSAVYWGLGYTILYHRAPYALRGAGADIDHVELWYWFPPLNFPMPRSYFVEPQHHA